MLKDAVSEDCYQGSETGDASADDGDIGLESRPNTEVDAFPFTTVLVIRD